MEEGMREDAYKLGDYHIPILDRCDLTATKEGSKTEWISFRTINHGASWSDKILQSWEILWAVDLAIKP